MAQEEHDPRNRSKTDPIPGQPRQRPQRTDSPIGSKTNPRSPQSETERSGGTPRNSGHPMAAALQSAIGRMESAGQVRASLALAYWPRVVGAQAAAATQVEAVRDGVLFVRTKSSVWSHELTLHKARILLGLNRMLGGKIIEEIIFRAQGVTKSETSEEPDTPDPEELAAVALDPGEKRELRVRLERLFHVKDEHTRRALAARLIQEAKLRHWRLERGWKVCRRCAALHKTAFALCPICRLGG